MIQKCFCFVMYETKLEWKYRRRGFDFFQVTRYDIRVSLHWPCVLSFFSPFLPETDGCANPRSLGRD